MQGLWPPLRTGGFPLIQLGILGERCKLPQRGPGQSAGRFAITADLEVWLIDSIVKLPVIYVGGKLPVTYR